MDPTSSRGTHTRDKTLLSGGGAREHTCRRRGEGGRLDDCSYLGCPKGVESLVLVLDWHNMPY